MVIVAELRDSAKSTATLVQLVPVTPVTSKIFPSPSLIKELLICQHNRITFQIVLFDHLLQISRAKTELSILYH
jgi:hypothetical protein